MAARRRFPASGHRRKVAWAGAAIDEATISVAASVVVTTVTEAEIEADREPTIARVRGDLLVVNDTDSTAGAFGHLCMGLIVVDVISAASGAVPKPLTDIGSSWLWWKCVTIGEQIGSPDINGLSFNRVDVDSKAMRKTGLNQKVVLVMTLTQCEGTLVVNVCGVIRTLLMLQ